MGIGCARQSSPSGGDKDEQPPQIVYYQPPLFTTEFDSYGFEMEFDEYIRVNGYSSQLIVSPPLKKLPEYSLRGKKLIITWTDTLLPNTTYQFNFGQSVVDVNEGNVNTDLIYVFSTGDYIDSLSISGKVVSAKTNVPLPAAAVLIYRAEADSLPTTSPPDYFTLTDASGNFKIKYLPEGDFKIFALKEENSNYIYNGPPEQIGFYDGRVFSSLNDSTDIILLPAFIEKDTTQYIASQKSTDYGYYEIAFNTSTINPDVQFYDVETDKKLEAVSQINIAKDTIKSWVSLPDRDNFEEAVVYIRDDTTFADTAFWYFETNPKYKEKAELKISSNTTANKLDLEKSLTLDFSNPIVDLDTSLVYFMEDSVQIFPTEFKRLNLNRQISVSYPYKASSKYIFNAKPGAFVDVFGIYSDTVSISFNLRDSEFYGSLSIAISAAEKNDENENKILQVLDGQGKIIAERTYTKNLETTFLRMIPGKYKLQVIFDENDNGKWDTGVYRNKIQPERLSFYPEEIEVRSNWEFEVEWTPTTPFD